MRLRTPDGEWDVEVATFDTHQEFKVRRYGMLASCGATGRQKDMGRCATVAEVAAVIGDAFATLEEVR